MANNITVKDAAAANQVVKTTDNLGVHTPHQNIDSLPAVALDAPTLAALETIELGTTTLAALETITVASVTAAVDLSAATLAALETIELGATTLAALETITANAGTGFPSLAAEGDTYPAGATQIGALVAKVGTSTPTVVDGDLEALSVHTTGHLRTRDFATATHDAAAGTALMQIGGYASAVNFTGVTADAENARLWCDRKGRLITSRQTTRGLRGRNKITLSNTTETTLVAATASVFHDLTKLVITNTSSTAVRVDIRDTTAGTVVMEVAIAANGGAVIDFSNDPLEQAAVNTNWTAQLSAAVTDVRIFAHYINET